MGLTFTVGNPADDFSEPFAEQVRATFASHFGESIVFSAIEEPYFSEEVAWSGWRLLQEAATKAVGAERLPHFLSMEAWFGCYVPAETRPGNFEFGGESTPLAVACLPDLITELKSFGESFGLPIHDAELHDLATKYQDDDLIDSDDEIQTYAQLLLAAHEAQRRRQVLWVVK